MSTSDATFAVGPSASQVEDSIPDRAHLERLRRAALAANALCEVLWEALHAELGARSQRQSTRGAVAEPEAASTQRAAELAGRLADIAAIVTLLASAQRPTGAPPGDGLGATAQAVQGEPPAARPPPAAGPIEEVDEHPREPWPGQVRGTSPPSDEPRARAHPWDAPADERSRAAATSPGDAEPAHSNGKRPAAWINLIADALARFERDRVPFAVVLIEVLELEPLWHGVQLAEVPHLVRQVESAAARALETIGAASSVSLALESPTRFWLRVPQTDGPAVRALAERLLKGLEGLGHAASTAAPAERYFAALSARRPPSHAEARLELAIGTSACPEDGEDVTALATRADVELAAMRRAKVPGVAIVEPV
jgi:hypothetical protein